jgi:hypothetical protein
MMQLYFLIGLSVMFYIFIRRAQEGAFRRRAPTVGDAVWGVLFWPIMLIYFTVMLWRETRGVYEVKPKKPRKVKMPIFGILGQRELDL